MSRTNPLVKAAAERKAEQNGHVPDPLEISEWDAVEEKETMWLKDQEIPRGELTLLTGRGDLGKTTVEVDWISAASRGRMSEEPIRILHIAEGEVGAERAKAMLRATGADGSMVTFDKPRSLMTIPEDVPRLVTTIKQREIGLVAFDNLEAHVDLAGGDPYSENTIRRRVINPLRFCAQETNIAILGIKHPPKAGGGHAHDLFGGSAAWINASRSGFLVRSDPDQQDRRVRLLLHVKGNLARGLVDTREFRLVPSLYQPNVPVIAWGDERPEVTLDNFDAPTFRDQLGLLIRGAVRADALGPAEVAKILPDFTPAAIKKRMLRMGNRGELKRHEGGSMGYLPDAPTAPVPCPRGGSDGDTHVPALYPYLPAHLERAGTVRARGERTAGKTGDTPVSVGDSLRSFSRRSAS